MREILKVYAPAILLIVIGFMVALYFVTHPPPKELRADAFQMKFPFLTPARLPIRPRACRLKIWQASASYRRCTRSTTASGTSLTREGGIA